MTKEPDKKYTSSTKREIAPDQLRTLKFVLIGLGILCLVVVVLAFLVATGELALR